MPANTQKNKPQLIVMLAAWLVGLGHTNPTLKESPAVNSSCPPLSAWGGSLLCPAPSSHSLVSFQS